ncbi:MAG TPA: FtsX-like permease family protein, partial [Actinobacteria bacterium]|nr:FtsX-like permease family protein [Actinomycetota bacterium]
AKHGRGLICLSLTPERVEDLKLPMMTDTNTSSFGTPFTVSARIARRSAMRHRKRTILILVLIALPVAAAIVVAGFVRASQDDPVRATQGTFGAASVRIDTGTPGSALDDWIADQIAGEPDADFTKYRELYTDLGWGGELLDINLGHPLARGIFFVVEGTTPSVRNQVALSSRLANRLQASVGDTVELTLGGSTTLGYTVTGLVQDPLRIRRAFAIVTPQEMDAAIARAEAQRAERDNTTVVASQVRSTWLVGGVDSRFSARVLSEWERSGTEFWPTPAVDPRPPELEFLSVETYYSLDAGAIEELVDLASTLGDEALREAAFDRVDPDRMVSFPWVDAVSRDEWVRRVATGESTLGGPPALGTLVSVLLLAEVALVAGAAYATGIRRRMREIGLLGSNGATDTHVRTIVVGEGIVAGLLGSTLGTAMAVTLLIMGRPLMQRFVDRLLTAPPVAVADVVGPAVVGVLAATVAAWAPARTASSVPTVAALHGRMPQKAPRRWIAPAGLGLVGFGMLLVIVAEVALGQGAAIQAGLGVIFMV